MARKRKILKDFEKQIKDLGMNLKILKDLGMILADLGNKIEDC